jgi:hypothetical protein
MTRRRIGFDNDSAVIAALLPEEVGIQNGLSVECRILLLLRLFFLWE